MILVTGAVGNVGRVVARRLAERGAEVRALVRKPEKFKIGGVATAPGHLDDEAALAAAVEGCETMFLLSRVAPDMARIQIAAAERAARAGVKRIVKLSGLDASPEARLTLGRWHGEIERRIETLGVAYTHIRPNAFMQNLLAGARRVASAGEVDSPAGKGAVSMIDARDVAEVAVEALLNPAAPSFCEITGPAAINVFDIAAALARALGRPVRAAPLTGDEARSYWTKAGLPDWWSALLVELYESYARGEAARITTTVSDVLGRPARALDQFVADHAALFEAAA